MKRIAILMSFSFLLAAPAIARPALLKTVAKTEICTELPWSTVQAVLKKVATMGRYSYAFLESGYDAGTVTVAQNGTAYFVTIALHDGATDAVIIDSF